VGTRIAIFFMSLVLIAIGVFALKKSIFGNLTPADAGSLAGLLGLAAGLLGLTICGTLVTHSMQLTKIEKTLEHRG
jgi:hypothetical protein